MFGEFFTSPKRDAENYANRCEELARSGWIKIEDPITQIKPELEPWRDMDGGALFQATETAQRNFQRAPKWGYHGWTLIDAHYSAPYIYVPDKTYLRYGVERLSAGHFVGATDYK